MLTSKIPNRIRHAAFCTVAGFALGFGGTAMAEPANVTVTDPPAPGVQSTDRARVTDPHTTVDNDDAQKREGKLANAGNHREILRDFLGVEVSPLTKDDLSRFPDTELEPGVGLKVNKVAQDSRAQLAGLREGDVIVRLSNQWIINEHQLVTLLSMQDADDDFEIMTYRRNDQTNEIQRIDHDFEFDQTAISSLLEGNERLAVASIDQSTQREMTRSDNTDRDRNVAVSDEDRRREQAAASGGLIIPETFSHEDDRYEYDLRTDDGVKKLTVKDTNGNIVFEGPYNTLAERNAVPDEIRTKFESALRSKVK